MSDRTVHEVALQGQEQVIQGLEGIAAGDAKVAAATQQEAQAAQQATAATRTREQKLRDLQQRLEELVREQLKVENAQKRGIEVDNKLLRSGQRREAQIRRISRALASESEVHRRAGAAVDSHNQSATRLGATMGNMVGQFAGVTSAAGGLLLVLRQISAEYENIKRRQEAAFQSQQTLASAQRDLKLNMAGASAAEIDQAMAAGKQIGSDTGIGQTAATAALASAYSATGGDLESAIRMTKLGAQIRPDRPEQVAQIAGAFGDIANSIGTKNEYEAAGYFSQVAGLSRIANFQRQVMNIPKPITGLVNAGYSPASAGALFAAQTVGSADITGEMSGTAVISFAEQLNDFMKGQGLNLKGEQALAYLQSHPDLAQAFMGQATFERKSLAPIRDLVLNPNSTTAQLYASDRRKLGSASFESVGRGLVGRLASGDVEQTADVNRRLAATVEAIRNGDLGGGRAGAIRDQLVELLKATGEDTITQKLMSLDFTASGGLSDDPQAAQAAMIEILRSSAQSMRGPRYTGGFYSRNASWLVPFGLGSPIQAAAKRDPTGRELRNAQTIEALANQLDSTSGGTVVNNYNGPIINHGGDTTTKMTGRDQ